MSSTEHVRVPESVKDEADRLYKEKGFATLGEAIRHMCREGDYDV